MKGVIIHYIYTLISFTDTMSLAPSKIFCGFRALGFTSNHVPLVTRYHKRHKDNYVVTCVGQAFHVYNVSIYQNQDSFKAEIFIF